MYNLTKLQHITKTVYTDAEGCCADVWYLDDQLILKRIQNTDTSSLIFMQYCLDNIEDVHLPDIIAVYKDEDYHYLVIERLEHNEDLRGVISDCTDNTSHKPLSGDKYREHLGSSFSNSLDNLVEFYNNTPELNSTSSWDLHFNNMMDRDGIAIIVDPFCPNESMYNSMVDTTLVHRSNEMYRGNEMSSCWEDLEGEEDYG